MADIYSPTRSQAAAIVLVDQRSLFGAVNFELGAVRQFPNCLVHPT